MTLDEPPPPPAPRGPASRLRPPPTGLRPARWAGLAATLAVVLTAGTLTACSTSAAPTRHRTTGSSAAPSSTAPSSTAPTAAAVATTTRPGAGSDPAGPPLAVPTSGALLGAWLHPGPAVRGAASFPVEARALPAVRAATGRPLGLLHVFVPWRQAAPVASLEAVRAAGSVPLLDWGCAPSGADIASGTQDGHITAFARALATYAHPVLLRWCWEMNLVRSHPEVTSPAAFRTDWAHLHDLFRLAGATNVSFVWCPALTGVDPAPYYPGTAEVDWIGVDGYDRTGTSTFTGLFAPFVARWAGEGKPIMVAETGARPPAQPAYLASIGAGAPSLPAIKAVAYFDAPGPDGAWQLTPGGVRAFATLAGDDYFAPS